MGIRVRKMVAVGHLVHKYDEIICSIHQGGHPASHHDPPVGGPWWGSFAKTTGGGGALRIDPTRFMRVKMNIALRKRALSSVRLILEDSSKRSFMLFVDVSLQLGSIIQSNLI